MGNLREGMVEEWRLLPAIRWDIESLRPEYPGRRILVVCAVCKTPVKIDRYGATLASLYVGCDNFFRANSQQMHWGCWNNSMALGWCQGSTPEELAKRYRAALPAEVYCSLVERSDGRQLYSALETLAYGSPAYVARATHDFFERRGAAFDWWTDDDG